jgi:hypothetical protein
MLAIDVIAPDRALPRDETFRRSVVVAYLDAEQVAGALANRIIKHFSTSEDALQRSQADCASLDILQQTVEVGKAGGVFSGIKGLSLV